MFLTGAESFKGFVLEKDYELDRRVMVVTGKNGCGKTRLMESIVSGATHLRNHDRRLSQSFVVYLKHTDFIPDFSNRQNTEALKAEAKNAARLLKAYQEYLVLPVNPNVPPKVRVGDILNGISLEVAACIYGAVAKIVNKPLLELTSEEVEVYYLNICNPQLGVCDVASTLTQFSEMKERNEYHQYRALKRGEGHAGLTEEQLISVFGGQPLEVLNDALKTVLGERFIFREAVASPNNNVVYLFHVESGARVDVEALSSGEKTLVWLCMVLYGLRFNLGAQRANPVLLLLDEPDAFLHPEMVSKLYAVLEVFVSSYDVHVLFSTHSPTTIALAPEGGVLLLESGVLKPVVRDEAIADLLYGVSQVSIDSNNQRQVFVESFYDAEIYKTVFDFCARKKLLNSYVDLKFMPAALRLPEGHIKSTVNQYFGVIGDDVVKEFVSALGGASDCSRVRAQVADLLKNGNRTVRGVVDWDLNSKDNGGVYVHAENYAYSIENVIYDPVSILRLLISRGEYVPVLDGGLDFDVWEWQNSAKLVQASIDDFVCKVLNDDNKKDDKLTYLSGVEFLTDKRYLCMKGHDLEGLIVDRFPSLKELCRRPRNRLPETVIRTMLVDLRGSYIPKSFGELFAKLQAN